MNNNLTDLKILQNFTINSNFIEGIYAVENDPEYDNHLETVMKIEEVGFKKGIIMHPISIHTMLMKNILHFPGIYRSIRVYINDINDFVDVPFISKNMEKWFESLKDEVISLKNEVVIPSVVEQISWHYHHWFENIHPFIDGNGRTGRLILNNIRRVFGLPWLIIKGTPPSEHQLIKEHKEYYESIKKWRKINEKLLITKV